MPLAWVSGQMLQQIGLGGTMIALPIYLQIVLEYSAMGAAACRIPNNQAPANKWS